jgi:pSer/pThr/pTyr-binding forkhead associated (FHA) protein
MAEEKLRDNLPEEKPEVAKKNRDSTQPTPPTAEGSTEAGQDISPDEAAAANKEMSLEERVGSTSPFQLSISLSGEVLQSPVFDKDFVSIGRDLKCDVIVDNLGASRVHAQIERIGRFCLLRDMGSKTGTFVHGKKVEEYCLNPGDEVFLAKHSIVFQKLSSMRWHVDEMADKSGRPPTKGMQRQQMMQTMAVDFRDMAKKQGPAPAYLHLSGSNRRLPITKNAIFFGKSQRCDISITGFLIGERHVVLVQEEKGFMLYHLGMFKPPRINNKLVEVALLESGDLLQIGDIQCIFHVSEEKA